MSNRRLLRSLRTNRLLVWDAILAAQTALLRLIYPLAIVLIEHAWAGLALVLTALSIALSALRGWTADYVTRVVRARLFGVLSEAIESYPALAPPEAPPVEQLESEIAKGIPWVESLLAITFPGVIGNALALPVIGWLSWVHVGARATLVAAVALVCGALVGAWVARHVGRAAREAWNGYQPVCRLIESGFRGRVELGVHQRASAHRERLLAEVANWSRMERRSFVWSHVAGWTIPAVTALAAVTLAVSSGASAGDLLNRLLTQPSRAEVIGGLLALTALPVLAAVSRAVADGLVAFPHVVALERFVAWSRARPSGPDAAVARGVLGSIRAAHVSFAYPARQNEPPWRLDADLSWELGETLAVCGSNGCGKTTLTWLLMGMLEPLAGSVTVQVDGASHSPAALAGRIAYLPQQPYFAELESVREAIRFTAPQATDQAIEELISELLAGHYSGDVKTLLERRAMSLSVGERRVVALARVLLRGSELVFLDEPEANLDAEIRSRVLRALVRVKSRCRMLLVTHDTSFAAIADRSYHLPSGDAGSARARG